MIRRARSVFCILVVLVATFWMCFVIYQQRNIWVQTKNPAGVLTLKTTVTTTTFKPTESCLNISVSFVGRLNVSLENDTWESVEKRITNVKPGGRYTPLTCIAKGNLAIIIPYRDREEHLKIFLRYMHPFLQHQNLNYVIYVVEMPPNMRFNRALLMNIGFVEALKEMDFGCFIFHDVDQLPEDDRISYNCEHSPQHLAVAMDKHQYKLPYHSFFGGVCAFSKEHFQTINGASNIYFGWGGEDDDLHERIKYNGMKVKRLSSDIYRYKMIPHQHAEESPDKFKLYKTMKQRHKTDGINSLRYNVSKIEHKPLYTWILVSFNETDIMENELIHKEAFTEKVNVPKLEVTSTANNNVTNTREISSERINVTNITQISTAISRVANKTSISTTIRNVTQIT